MIPDPDTVGITNGVNAQYGFLSNLTPAYYPPTIINLLFGFAGVGFFIYLLWGGLQWITAGGDKDAIDKARKKIMNAVIGIIIVFSTYVILYIIRTLFNVNFVGFNLSKLGT
jgi:hypothetical protein